MDNHRASRTLSLGEIMESLYTQREASWEVSDEFKRRGFATTQKGAASGKNESGAGTPKAGTSAHDGRLICPKWKTGKCADPCVDSKFHGCPAVLKNGRLCGRRDHKSVKDCTNPNVARS